jgi:acyl-CoA oxidase
LSGGRVGITGATLVHARLALTIAVRYSTARKQFQGPGQDEENRIWDYRAQRYRLIPRIAEVLTINVMSKWLMKQMIVAKLQIIAGTTDKKILAMDAEIHSISSASKPYASYASRDAIQECREACGGHGYAAVNRLGMLRDDNDPNVTYEGENRVLLQQASRYLLKGLQAIMQRKDLKDISPLGSIACLSRIASPWNFIFPQRFKGNSISALNDPKILIDAYEWRLCNLVTSTGKKLKAEYEKNKKDPFGAWNRCQIFYGQNMAFAYIELLTLRLYFEALETVKDQGTKAVLHKFGILYGLNRMVVDLGNFRDGDFVSSKQAEMIKERVLQLCDELKDDSVALIEHTAFPDHIIRAPIGLSNGMPYLNYFNKVVTPESYERADFWEMTVNGVKPGSRAKL